VQLGTAVFTKNLVAETLSTLLEAPETWAGPAVTQALAETYRAVAQDESSSSFARESLMRRLVAFMPPELLLPLPQSVEHRGMMAALAGATALLPVRASWHDGQSRLSANDAIGLLKAAAPFIGNRSIAKEARAVINRLLELGPPLAELLRDPRGEQLKIIHATRVLDKKEEILTLVNAPGGRQGRRSVLARAGYPSRRDRQQPFRA